MVPFEIICSRISCTIFEIFDFEEYRDLEVVTRIDLIHDLRSVHC